MDPSLIPEWHLDALEVAVPDDWRKGTRRKAKRPRWGACFEAAATYALDHDIPDLLVVHGSYAPNSLMRELGLRLGHAWVEIGDVAYDGNGGRFYDRASYYEAIAAEPIDHYTRIEAARLMVESGHHGPWSESFPSDPIIAGQGAGSAPR